MIKEKYSAAQKSIKNLRLKLHLARDGGDQSLTQQQFNNSNDPSPMNMLGSPNVLYGVDPFAGIKTSRRKVKKPRKKL